MTDMIKTAVRCMDCGAEFSYEKPDCPNCHSDRLNVHFEVLETFRLRETKEKYSAKNSLLKGKAKIRKEGRIERTTSKDTKTGYAIVERHIDRDRNAYYEKVSDENGNVIHFCEEKLSDHQGHGSAKCNRKS